MREIQPQLGWEMVHFGLYQEARLEITETQSTVTRKGFPLALMTGSSLNAIGISLKIIGHMVITHCPIQDKILVKNNTVMIGSPFGEIPVGAIIRENIVGAVPDLTNAHTVMQTIPVETVPFSSQEKKGSPLLSHKITLIRANRLEKILIDSGYDKNKTRFLVDGFRQTVTFPLHTDYLGTNNRQSNIQKLSRIKQGN